MQLVLVEGAGREHGEQAHAEGPRVGLVGVPSTSRVQAVCSLVFGARALIPSVDGLIPSVGALIPSAAGLISSVEALVPSAPRP